MFSAIGVAWPPAIFMVSDVSSVPAGVVVLTAVDIPGVPAVPRVFAAVAAVPTSVYILSATGFSNVSGIPDVVDIPAAVGVTSVAGVPTVVKTLLFMVFPSVVASLLLASPDVPVVSSAAVAPPVTVLAVARGLYPGVPDVVGVIAVASGPTVFSTCSGTPAVVGAPCFSSCLLCC